ncbi:DUF551 domain-containing protein [Citrobacter farmeri]|uniref:DUF551 domain-containing protein n=1 Tax=Citrobacter farmeri TaxID=67824 RepID=UPI00293038CB|nr:DUF551 domain-containing protein [Citrobacter farmeri]
MSTITRERLLKIQQWRETYGPGSNVVLPAEEAEELARIALASLTAEPALYAADETLAYANMGEIHLKCLSQPMGDAVIPLYTAPSASVSVPECFMRLLHHAYGMTMGHDWNKGTMAGHHRINLCQAVEDCRAAMLQGANDSLTHEGKNHPEDKLGMVNHLGDANEKGNSPVIPEGWVMVPIEPTEDMIVNGFESEPDESFSDEKEWEVYDDMSGCQQAAHRAKLCWAAMIAAAPKLE